MYTGLNFSKQLKTAKNLNNTMKKEYTIVLAILLFIGSYAIDSITGPVGISVKNPIVFLSSDILLKLPLTGLSVGLKTVGIIITTLLLFSIMEKKYFTKTLISVILAIVAIFYSIQQLASGGRVTSIQWTLSFAYSGIILVGVALLFLVAGILNLVHSTLRKALNKDEVAKADNIIEEQKKEV